MLFPKQIKHEAFFCTALLGHRSNVTAVKDEKLTDCFQPGNAGKKYLQNKSCQAYTDPIHTITSKHTDKPYTKDSGALPLKRACLPLED